MRANSASSGRLIDQDGAIAVLFAIATTLMLQSVRVFTSYLVFVVDQSERTTIGLVTIVVFAFPVTCWILVRLTQIDRLVAVSVVLLAASRIILQIIEQPVVRLTAGGTAVIAWGVLTVLLIATYRRPVAAGLILGFTLDLAFRTARGGLDLPWIPGIYQTLQVVVLVALLLAIWWSYRTSIEEPGATWRSAAPLIIVGPAIGIFHLVTGNIAFVSTHTGLSASGSSTVLAAGIALGVAIATLRLLAFNLGVGGGQLIGRFILFDAIIGSIALSFIWSGDGLELLGALVASITATELVLFALASGESRSGDKFGPVVIITTLGLLLQFVALFLYYTATGSGLMLGIIWSGLVAGTALSALSMSSTLERRPLQIRTYAGPFLVAALLLAGSIVWAAFNRETPEASAVADETFTVITYNIQSGFSRDNHWNLDATAEVIENSGADIVILQEVSRGWLVMSGNDQLAWLSRRLDMPYSWGPASTDDLWGNAVLSRFPIESQSLVRYDSTQNLKRSALTVRLDIGARGTLTVISTHLDNPSGAGSQRSEQVEQLIPLLDVSAPMILAGDFNMDPDDPLVEKILSVGLTDAAVVGDAEVGTSETNRRIDYILVSDSVSVVEVEVIDTSASDHRPVVATLAIR